MGDHHPGAVLGQVLKRPQQGALPMPDVLGDGHENSVVHKPRAGLSRLLYILSRAVVDVRGGAHRCPEAVPPPERSAAGTLHSSAAVVTDLRYLGYANERMSDPPKVNSACRGLSLRFLVV
jgi:hypothetical protein